MKQRVITGIIIAAFLVVWLLCMFTPVFPVFAAALAALCTYEVHKVAGIQNIPLRALSMLASAIVALCGGSLAARFEHVPVVGAVLGAICARPYLFLSLYVMIALVLMLAQYRKTRFEHVAISIFSGVALPFAFYALVRLTALTDVSAKNVFFVMFSFSCAWVTDIFALFTGRAFGRRKLSPNISPKKTVEGAAGGIVCAMGVNLLMLWIFNRYALADHAIPYLPVALVSLVLSVAGMCGDLSASVIKRNYGAKDFSNILPGHGGIMDRFDSCLFVWPCLYGIASNLIAAWEV